MKIKTYFANTKIAKKESNWTIIILNKIIIFKHYNNIYNILLNYDLS
jgi:hypothetical protein